MPVGIEEAAKLFVLQVSAEPDLLDACMLVGKLTFDPEGTEIPTADHIAVEADMVVKVEAVRGVDVQRGRTVVGVKVFDDHPAGFDTDVAGIVTGDGRRRKPSRRERDRNGQLSHIIPLSVRS